MPTAANPPSRRPPRLAAGRARTLGVPTRGTTAANRLRRIDRWTVWALGPLLRASSGAPLVVDLGFGATPVTTVELHARLSAACPGVQVVGLEIDPERVATAAAAAVPGQLTFRRGGFELAGLAPVVVRAMNVLRQYDEEAVGPAWQAMTATGAVLVEGTCDEIGRRACWFAVEQGRPTTFTVSAHLATLPRPSELAERLPKALIARNVPGRPVHALLTTLDAAWDAAAPYATFGPRQRWIQACARLQADGWPVRDGPRRWRLGELTLDAAAVLE